MPLFRERQTQGVLELGTPQQLKTLFTGRELVSAPAAVSLAPTNPDLWKIWPRRNQGDQDSCVYHARAKAAGILQEQATGEFVEYSAADYNKRSNAPAAGAYPVEAFDYWRTMGVGLESLEPSNDVQAAMLYARKQTTFEKKAALISLLGGYYSVPAYDFDMLVSTLHATKKPIPLGFYGTYSEWSRNVPRIENPNLELAQGLVRHEVCATPNYGIYDGEEGFTIEDSWGSAGIAGTGVRWITRSFFRRRNYIAGLVPTTFKDYEEIGIDPAKPKVKLTRDLYKGVSEGADIRDLQTVLKYEGFFPANHSGSTYFGDITERGVKQYQSKYGIINEGTPETTGYGRVGPATRSDINKRYR